VAGLPRLELGPSCFKGRRAADYPTGHQEPSPGADPGHSPYKGEVTAVCDGFVRSAGVEPATSRLSTWPLCQLEYEHVEPLPGADPGHPRYEGGAAAVRSGLAGIPGFEPGCSGFRARRVCQFPHIPSVRAAGVEPARAHAHQVLSLARLPITPRPRAPPGNRTPFPRLRVGCFTAIARGAEPHAGIEPAFLAWKASTLAIVLVRHGDSGWDRTSGLLGFNQALVPTELQSHQSVGMAGLEPAIS
jgi:hypothetical protein